MKQQNGGTILGFIIGLVVGLAVALAVAVYVTKVPIPFIDKGQSRNADQDVAESQKNKNWDPNSPLYGKNPAKPSVPASAPLEASSATVSLPTSEVKPVEAADKSKAKPDARPASTADPLGDLVKARAGNAAAEPFLYFVQVGAFRSPEDAESQRAKLSLSGVEAKVTEREQVGRTVYRVRVGPFDKKEEADKIKEKLDAAGHETALVRVQR
jgi:cell division protein FtsN